MRASPRRLDLRRCRCGSGRRRCGSRATPGVRPWRGRRPRRRRRAVTASTRPPAVTTSPSPSSAVPAWMTSTPSARSAVVEPVIDVAGARTRPGSPRAATTTATAAPSCQRERLELGEPPVGGGVQQRRRAASRSSASSGWVSGSPKRALNSITRTPRAVSASPAYSRPANGVPRRASSSTVGWSTALGDLVDQAVRRPRQRGVGAHAAGVRARRRRRATRLKSCAGCSGHDGRAVGDREQRHLGAVEELLDHAPARRRRRARAPRRGRR